MKREDRFTGHNGQCSDPFARVPHLTMVSPPVRNVQGSVLESMGDPMLLHASVQQLNWALMQAFQLERLHKKIFSDAPQINEES